MRIRMTLRSVLLSSLFFAAPASADSLLDVFDAVPAPPADVASAQTWVSADKVTAPRLLALEARVKAGPVAATSTDAAPDAAAVQLAVGVYKAYASANSDANAPAAVLGSRANWLSGRYAGLRKRTPEADTARMAELKEQELASFRALFADWKMQRRGLVAEAQAALASAGDPSLISAPDQREAIQQYRAAMQQEIELLIGLTRHAVARAAGLSSAEPVAVQPGANTLWDLMRNPTPKTAR